MQQNGCAVIIIGMHRCGTSLVANIASRFGVYFGNNLMSPDPGNPKGYYEDLNIVAFHDAMLADISERWDSIILPRFSEGYRENFKKNALAILKKNFLGHKLWGFKDPRLTRFITLWDELFMENGISRFYIMANRNPFSVAESLFKRNYMSPEISFLLWLAYQTQSLEAVLRNKGAVVSYDRLVRDPGNQTQAIIGTLTRFCLSEGINKSFDSVDVSGVVDVNLNRSNQSGLYMDVDDEVMRTSMMLHQYLESISDYSKLSDLPEFEMNRGIELAAISRKYINKIKSNISFAKKIHAFYQRQMLKQEKIIAKRQSEIDWMESKMLFKLASWISRSIKGGFQ